jgi:hypothetical protein
MKFRLSFVSFALLLFLSVILGGLPSVASAQGATPWVASKRFGDVVHFLFTARIERFDLNQGTWLSPLSLPRTGATAMEMSATGLYVAYGSACYTYTSTASSEAHLRNTTSEIHELHADGNFLFLNYSDGLYGQLDSIRLSDRRLMESFSTYVDSSYGTVIVPSKNKIFGVTAGISPADVVMTSYNEDGTINESEGSPYHGDFSIGNRVFASPSGNRVLTTTGVVYSTTDLRYVSSMGGAVEHMDFLSDGRSVVLRDNKVYAYSDRFFSTGSAAVSPGTLNVFSSASAVYAFRPDSTRVAGVTFQVVPHSSLVFPAPGQGVSPVGLSFVPDAVVTDKNGKLLILSRLDGCVFVWDPETQAWSDKWFVLRGEPTYMAYSDANHALYLSYEGGSITTLDLNASSPVEVMFANMPADVHGLAAAGQFLLVADPTGAWASHTILSPTGEELHRVDWNYYSQNYEWSPVTRRMFFIRDDSSPKDIHYEKISPQGLIVEEGESPYHASEGIAHPIRASRDGSQVLLGSGRIYDADGNLSLLGTLANPLIDGVWLNDKLVTITADGGQTRWQQWSTTSSYAETASGLLNGTPRHVRRLPDDRYVIMTQVSGKPAFRLFTPAGDLVQPPTPLAPANFSGSVISGGVLLRWTDLPQETGYVIERRLNEASPWVALATLPANSTSYRDTSAGASQNAYYRIHALRDDLVGEVSESLQLALLLPTSPALLEAVPTVGGAELSWQAALRAAQYRIERRLLSAASFTAVGVVNSPLTNFKDATASSDTSYVYRVLGVNGVGNAPTYSPEVEVKTLGLPFTAIYRLTRSVSGTRNGAEPSGKIIKATIRKSETGYVVVDLNQRTASQILYWSEAIPGTKSKMKRYRVETVNMQYLVIPQMGGKWQFSAMSIDQGSSLPGHEGLWAKLSEVIGTAAPYKLPGTSIQYPSLPTKLAGRERFTFMGQVQENATVTSELKTIDCSLTLVLDTKLSASTITGPNILNAEEIYVTPRSAEHALLTVIRALNAQGYTAERPE